MVHLSDLASSYVGLAICCKIGLAVGLIVAALRGLALSCWFLSRLGHLSLLQNLLQRQRRSTVAIVFEIVISFGVLLARPIAFFAPINFHFKGFDIHCLLFLFFQLILGALIVIVEAQLSNLRQFACIRLGSFLSLLVMRI